MTENNRRRTDRDGFQGAGLLENILFVAVGGGAGSVVRYLTSAWAAERFGADFPYGTLIVNVVGCYIIGFFMILATEKYLLPPHWRLLIASGFLGGLTTFSSFSYETLKLAQEGAWSATAVNLASNLITGLLATVLGVWSARAL